MNANEMLKKAQSIVEAGEYDDINDAICSVAESVLSQTDCETWHSAEITATTKIIISAFNKIGLTPVFWGSPDGPEPLSVTWM